MIQPKPKRGHEFIIIETGETVIFNRLQEHGYYFCDFKDKEGYDSFHPDDLKPLSKPRTAIKARPKTMTPEEIQHKQNINNMFQTVAKEVPKCCMECGKPLRAVKDWAIRCVSAHIIPKAEFPEVADDPDNIFFLGAAIIGVCACHDNWDRKGRDFRATMKVYKYALKQFNKFKHKLSSDRLQSALKYLKIDL